MSKCLFDNKNMAPQEASVDAVIASVILELEGISLIEQQSKALKDFSPTVHLIGRRKPIKVTDI